MLVNSQIFHVVSWWKRDKVVRFQGWRERKGRLQREEMAGFIDDRLHTRYRSFATHSRSQVQPRWIVIPRGQMPIIAFCSSWIPSFRPRPFSTPTLIPDSSTLLSRLSDTDSAFRLQPSLSRSLLFRDAVSLRNSIDREKDDRFDDDRFVASRRRDLVSACPASCTTTLSSVHPRTTESYKSRARVPSCVLSPSPLPLTFFSSRNQASLPRNILFIHLGKVSKKLSLYMNRVYVRPLMCIYIY